MSAMSQTVVSWVDGLIGVDVAEEEVTFGQLRYVIQYSSGKQTAIPRWLEKCKYVTLLA